MEWMNRGTQPQPAGQPVNHTGGGTHKSKKLPFVGQRVASVGLLFCMTILVVALVWFVALGGPKAEGKFVDNKKLQAVFLAGGQVYFGNINNLNDDYLRMTNIYYLRVNQTVQPNQQQSNSQQQQQNNDISLVKLGCELHGPADEMLINREQVIFWENLKEDGQVAKAVAEYVKQNPDGQKCTTESNTNNNSSNSNNNRSSGSNNSTQQQTQNSTAAPNSTGSNTGTGANQ